MAFWRRILAVVTAAAMVLGPALACADFCPQPEAGMRRADFQTTSDLGAPAATMPEGCPDRQSGRAHDPSLPPSHHPDCQGCPAITSVKNPAAAFVSAYIADAPRLVMHELTSSPVAMIWRSSRHRLTPPANGPPAAAPVILKDILRL